jgi:hypothetical protein
MVSFPAQLIQILRGWEGKTMRLNSCHFLVHSQRLWETEGLGLKTTQRLGMDWEVNRKVQVSRRYLPSLWVNPVL